MFRDSCLNAFITDGQVPLHEPGPSTRPSLGVLECPRVLERKKPEHIEIQVITDDAEEVPRVFSMKA